MLWRLTARYTVYRPSSSHLMQCHVICEEEEDAPFPDRKWKCPRARKSCLLRLNPAGLRYARTGTSWNEDENRESGNETRENGTESGWNENEAFDGTCSRGSHAYEHGHGTCENEYGNESWKKGNETCLPGVDPL